MLAHADCFHSQLLILCPSRTPSVYLYCRAFFLHILNFSLYRRVLTLYECPPNNLKLVKVKQNLFSQAAINVFLVITKRKNIICNCISKDLSTQWQFDLFAGWMRWCFHAMALLLIMVLCDWFCRKNGVTNKGIRQRTIFLCFPTKLVLQVVGKKWNEVNFLNVSGNFRVLLIQVHNMFSAKRLTKLWRICAYVGVVQERKAADKVLFATHTKTIMLFISKIQIR